MKQYYRGRFMIGIYALEHEGETCLAICENVREFAKLMETSEASARMILQYFFEGKSKKLVFQKKFRTLEFIDMLI